MERARKPPTSQARPSLRCPPCEARQHHSQERAHVRQSIVGVLTLVQFLDLARHHVDDILADVRHPVADALQIVRDEQQTRRGRDLRRVR